MNQNNKPVALFVIATNKYINFAKPLIESVEKFFLPTRKVVIYLFTNQEQQALDLSKRSNIDRVQVVPVKQEHAPWPHMTLLRYEIFKSATTDFSVFSHMFYCDVDMLFVDTVGEEILTQGLTATAHPGFFNKPREMFTYETDTKSHAAVRQDEGIYYFAGGFQGGSCEAYLTAINVCSSNVRTDLMLGKIAVWHDESHWNRYCIDHPPTRVLHPGYCCPETWQHLPFPRKLLALDKNHAEMRS